eukprot:gene1916-65_t
MGAGIALFAVVALLCTPLAGTLSWSVRLAYTDSGHWTIAHVAPAPHAPVSTRPAGRPPSKAAALDYASEGPHHVRGLVVAHADHSAGALLAQRFPDPVLSFYDHDPLNSASPEGAFGGGKVADSNPTVLVTVPPGTSTLMILQPPTCLPANAAAVDLHMPPATSPGSVWDLSVLAPTPLSRSRTLQHITWQLVGPTSSQPNLVFVSAGFLADEEDVFTEKGPPVLCMCAYLQVLECINVVGDAMPFSMFRSSFNFFSIFLADPGPESGITVPTEQIRRDTQLDCTYGDGVKRPARAVECNRALMRAFGETSPPEPDELDVVIALVNDQKNRGGTGGGGALTVWTGRDMGEILIHELGHAWGHLADEYGYGTTTSSTTPFFNCAHEADTQEGIYWTHWLGCAPEEQLLSADILAGPDVFLTWNEGTGDGRCGTFPDDLVSPVQQASSPCSYDNYRKPTTFSCIMKAASPHFSCHTAGIRSVVFGGIGHDDHID